jgi:hypothetical protein
MAIRLEELAQKSEKAAVDLDDWLATEPDADAVREQLDLARTAERAMRAVQGRLAGYYMDAADLTLEDLPVDMVEPEDRPLD